MNIRGFTLLMTLLYITATLSIGLGVGLLVMGELGLSGTGRESQRAFYAADFGAECALYWDLNGHKFPYNNNDALSDVSINDGCGGTGFIAVESSPNTYTFSVFMENSACANVTVQKLPQNQAIFVARGYNQSDGSMCPAPGGRTFERGLQITY